MSYVFPVSVSASLAVSVPVFVTVFVSVYVYLYLCALVLLHACVFLVSRLQFDFELIESVFHGTIEHFVFYRRHLQLQQLAASGKVYLICHSQIPNKALATYVFISHFV